MAKYIQNFYIFKHTFMPKNTLTYGQKYAFTRAIDKSWNI